jgi:hypothetical protein
MAVVGTERIHNSHISTHQKSTDNVGPTYCRDQKVPTILTVKIKNNIVSNTTGATQRRLK